MLRSFCALCGRICENPLLSLLSAPLVVLVVLFSFVMCCEPVEDWVGRLLGLCKKNEILKFLGIGIGGVLLAMQAVIANRRAKAMEKQAKAQADSVEVQTEAVREQAKANQETERGRRQDRLKDAIDHLGHASDSVRLGSAHELFQLAQDTPDARVTILSILCDHIRRTTGEDEYRREHLSHPSEEVQSLLTLLFVQPHKVFKGLQINLQGSWLNGANLQGARLDNAILTRAHLHGTILWQAYLRGADLLEASLNGAGLGYAHLQGALLPGARLYGATLIGAHLQGAILNGAHMQGAILDNTQLRGVRSGGETDLLEFSRQEFAERIRASVNQGRGLSNVILAGGLTREDVDSIVEGFSDEGADWLRGRLEPHIDTPQSNELPARSSAVTRAYTEEEAEQWIAEYRDEVER